MSGFPEIESFIDAVVSIQEIAATLAGKYVVSTCSKNLIIATIAQLQIVAGSSVHQAWSNTAKQLILPGPTE